MSNILDSAFEIITEIKLADKLIERTPVGDTIEIDTPDMEVPVRLKGGKHVKIVSVNVERTA